MWLIFNTSQNPITISLEGATLWLISSENKLWVILPSRLIQVDFQTEQDSLSFYNRVVTAIKENEHSLDAIEEGLAWRNIYVNPPEVTIANQPIVIIGGSQPLSVQVSNKTLAVEVVNRPTVDAQIYR